MGSHIKTPRPAGAPPDDAIAALEALRHLVRMLRHSAQTAERGGISGAQRFVLDRLARGPADSLDELSSRTLAHQSSVSVVVARLVDKGLVSRTRSELDGRQVRLALTARGRKLHRALPAVAQVKLLAAIERLPARERRALATGLTALARQMGATAAQPAPLFFEDRVARAPRRKQGKRRAAR